MIDDSKALGHNLKKRLHLTDLAFGRKRQIRRNNQNKVRFSQKHRRRIWRRIKQDKWDRKGAVVLGKVLGKGHFSIRRKHPGRDTLILIARALDMVPTEYFSWCSNGHFCSTIPPKIERPSWKRTWRVSISLCWWRTETQEGGLTNPGPPSSETEVDPASTANVLASLVIHCLWPYKPAAWSLEAFALVHSSFRHVRQEKKKNYHRFARRHSWTSDPHFKN